MITLCLVGLAVTNVCLLGGLLLAFVKVRSKFRELVTIGSQFIESKAEGELSPFGEVVDAVTTSISQKLAVGMQAALRGSIGGTLKYANAELEQEAIAQNPHLALLEAMPKSLKKNPLAMVGLQLALNKIANQMGSGAVASVGGNSGHGVKFNL